MAKTTKKKMSKPTVTKGKKGGNTMMMAGAAGAVVGAAIGGATAAALSDKKTRDKAGKMLSDVGNYAADTMSTMDEDPMLANDPTIHTQPTAQKKNKTGK